MSGYINTFLKKYREIKKKFTQLIIKVILKTDFKVSKITYMQIIFKKR